MYITVRGTPHRAARGARERVPRVVVLLGTVSLLTDLSSEMVVAILPVYLTVGLGLSPLQYGVLDGLYRGVTAVVRIAGGLAADLTRRPKAVAVVGYGLSAGTKLLLLPAQGFAALSAVITADRIGKGLRTAPRDAMIARAVPPQALGSAFGVHRAMDAVGALGGPLIAFAVLALLPLGYDVVFVLSFALGVLGVAVLVLFVPEHRDPTAPAATAPDAGPPPLRGRAAVRDAVRGVLRLARGGAYGRILAVAAVLSLATVTDGFVYLVLRDRAGVPASLFPLLFVGTSVTYLLLAAPLGRLADRVGRARVFLAGHLAAALAYVLLAHLPAGPLTMVAVVVALVGVYYACTDGVLAALTSAVVPPAARATGLAGVQTVVAAGGLLSAVGFGAVWTSWGPRAGVTVFAALLVAGVAAGAWLLRGADPVVAEGA